MKTKEERFLTPRPLHLMATKQIRLMKKIKNLIRIVIIVRLK